MKWFKVFGIIVIGIGLLYGSYLVVGSVPSPQVSLPQTAAAAPPSEARNTFVVQAVKTVGPSVVGITNKAYVRDNFSQRVLVDRGVGSGVIITADGYIVTNNHVVEGAAAIAVSLADGRTVDGKIIGVDPATDLAVVKVNVSGLPAVAFGDSDSLMVGEPAIAIGNPLGLEFRGSVTAGVISALNRVIEVGDRRFRLIQTDAPINPGNSGGALVNADGHVVGISSVKVSTVGVEGMGFAIPINTAQPIIKALVEKGKVVRAYLGISIMDEKTAAAYGYIIQADGVLVVDVLRNGPADQAGISRGDIIVKIDGKDVKSIADLREVLDALAVGGKVTVELKRDGRSITAYPVAAEMPN